MRQREEEGERERDKDRRKRERETEGEDNSHHVGPLAHILWQRDRQEQLNDGKIDRKIKIGRERGRQPLYPLKGRQA